MTDLNDAEIRYSKPFAYFATVVMIGLVCLFLFSTFQQDTTKLTSNGFLILIALNVFSFFLTFYSIKKYLVPAIKGENAVVLDKDYITDNIRHNLIKWNNVEGIRMTSSRGSAFIAIDLKNNSEVTSQTKNFFKKLLYLSNRFFFGTPTLIPTQFLEGSNQEILNLISNYFDRQKLLATKGMS